MPHRVTNDSNSSLASKGSGDSTDSNDQVIVTEVPVPAAKSNTSRRRRQPPVIVHNKGGQIYDETRPSDWDKQRWK